MDDLFAEFLGEIKATEKEVKIKATQKDDTEKGENEVNESFGGGKRNGEAEDTSTASNPAPAAKKMRIAGKLVAAARPVKASATSATVNGSSAVTRAPNSTSTPGTGATNGVGVGGVDITGGSAQESPKSDVAAGGEDSQVEKGAEGSSPASKGQDSSDIPHTEARATEGGGEKVLGEGKGQGKDNKAPPAVNQPVLEGKHSHQHHQQQGRMM
ncbi:unnamed protein product, partial [Choristocarpus tenellus]